MNKIVFSLMLFLYSIIGLGSPGTKVKGSPTVSQSSEDCYVSQSKLPFKNLKKCSLSIFQSGGEQVNSNSSEEFRIKFLNNKPSIFEKEIFLFAEKGILTAKFSRKEQKENAKEKVGDCSKREVVRYYKSSSKIPFPSLLVSENIQVNNLKQLMSEKVEYRRASKADILKMFNRESIKVQHDAFLFKIFALDDKYKCFIGQFYEYDILGCHVDFPRIYETDVENIGIHFIFKNKKFLTTGGHDANGLGELKPHMKFGFKGVEYLIFKINASYSDDLLLILLNYKNKEYFVNTPGNICEYEKGKRK